MFHIWQASIRAGSVLEERGDFVNSINLNLKQGMRKLLKWRETHRNDPAFVKHTEHVIVKFGDYNISRITFKMVQDWIEEDLSPNYSKNTIKHQIGCGKSLYNWLKKQGEYSGNNTFENHEFVAAKPGTFFK